jgi:small basic protein
MDAIRPFLSRIIAGWIAALIVFLNAKFGVTLDGDTQAAILTLGLGLFSTIYSIAHRLIDKKLNPGDAASSHLAVKELSEHDRLVK